MCSELYFRTKRTLIMKREHKNWPFACYVLNVTTINIQRTMYRNKLIHILLYAKLYAPQHINVTTISALTLPVNHNEPSVAHTHTHYLPLPLIRKKNNVLRPEIMSRVRKHAVLCTNKQKIWQRSFHVCVLQVVLIACVPKVWPLHA